MDANRTPSSFQMLPGLRISAGSSGRRQHSLGAGERSQGRCTGRPSAAGRGASPGPHLWGGSWVFYSSSGCTARAAPRGLGRASQAKKGRQVWPGQPSLGQSLRASGIGGDPEGGPWALSRSWTRHRSRNNLLESMNIELHEPIEGPPRGPLPAPPRAHVCKDTRAGAHSATQLEPAWWCRGETEAHLGHLLCVASADVREERGDGKVRMPPHV